MRHAALAVLGYLLLAACGPGERPPPPELVIPPAPTAREDTAPPRSAGGLPGPVIRPFPDVQQFLPGPGPEELGRGAAPVPQPDRTAGPFYTPPPSGPVTGYGPGGMAQPPGAPPNPPYPPGGLMPLR